jgi:hypothetical protein
MQRENLRKTFVSEHFNSHTIDCSAISPHRILLASAFPGQHERPPHVEKMEDSAATVSRKAMQQASACWST